MVDVQEEIATRMPTSPESSHLNIPEGTLVFEVIRTTTPKKDHSTSPGFIIRADMAVFDYRFPIPD